VAVIISVLVCFNHLSGYFVGSHYYISISDNNLLINDIIKNKTNHVKIKVESHYAHIYIQFKWKILKGVRRKRCCPHATVMHCLCCYDGFFYILITTSHQKPYIYIKYVCIFIIILLPRESTFTFINTGYCIGSGGSGQEKPVWLSWSNLYFSI